MRIVMVGPFGLRGKGTMSARALPLARALVKRGHETTLLIPPWDSPEDAGRRWTDAGVNVINIHLPPAIPVLNHLLITRRLVEQALKLQPDVVHAFKPKAYAGLTAGALWWLRRLGLTAGALWWLRRLGLTAGALWWLRRLGQTDIRLVIDTDDWEGPGGWNEIGGYTPAQRSFFTWQERWGLTHCDAVTVASRALQTLVWGLGVEPERVFYAPNGAEKAEVWPSDEARTSPEPTDAGARTGDTVLLYTRFVEFEAERLVAIWQRVVEAVPTARLVVAGQGLRGEERSLTRLAEGANIEGSIVCLGWPGRAAMPGVFAAANVAIMPFDDTLVNRTKCTMKLVELMAAGLPVVTEAVGQNRAYIEAGISGVLVEPGDVDAFARAVIALLRNPDEGHRLGAAARCRIAEHFTWERLVVRIEEAYAYAAGVVL
ncbi:MAG: N-acetyl-alpha-D-glucosaminyl L-malate synthase [Anaerolineales bacterium]|nr:N-acetyl-alpha-D-glucosaminyl L-malate synthase [Anaerolineales bacterium]